MFWQSELTYQNGLYVGTEKLSHNNVYLLFNSELFCYAFSCTDFTSDIDELN
jgi:hypothetical protein